MTYTALLEKLENAEKEMQQTPAKNRDKYYDIICALNIQLEKKIRDEQRAGKVD
jgi:hypothetical protein